MIKRLFLLKLALNFIAAVNSQTVDAINLIQKIEKQAGEKVLGFYDVKNENGKISGAVF